MQNKNELTKQILIESHRYLFGTSVCLEAGEARGGWQQAAGLKTSLALLSQRPGIPSRSVLSSGTQTDWALLSSCIQQ